MQSLYFYPHPSYNYFSEVFMTYLSRILSLLISLWMSLGWETVVRPKPVSELNGSVDHSARAVLGYLNTTFLVVLIRMKSSALTFPPTSHSGFKSLHVSVFPQLAQLSMWPLWSSSQIYEGKVLLLSITSFFFFLLACQINLRQVKLIKS